MVAYSPFDKRIEDLLPEDLDVLKDANEGWYIEYKSELVSATALAKAISSFANTYGGWLFLGVKERSKTDSVAGLFPGIAKQEMESAIQRLRKSSTDHLNPTPYFKTKALAGPCESIGLPQGRSVLAVEIPESNTAPHIHKDGRIYRRVADGSEPKYETDRFILDQLWGRAEPIKKVTREWVEGDPEFTEVEKKPRTSGCCFVWTRGVKENRGLIPISLKSDAFWVALSMVSRQLRLTLYIQHRRDSSHDKLKETMPMFSG